MRTKQQLAVGLPLSQPTSFLLTCRPNNQPYCHAPLSQQNKFTLISSAVFVVVSISNHSMAAKQTKQQLLFGNFVKIASQQAHKLAAANTQPPPLNVHHSVPLKTNDSPS